jgi:hypothetical protein
MFSSFLMRSDRKKINNIQAGPLCDGWQRGGQVRCLLLQRRNTSFLPIGGVWQERPSQGAPVRASPGFFLVCRVWSESEQNRAEQSISSFFCCEEQTRS